MANKITNTMNAIETKLNELVSADGSGLLKLVRRGVINPFTEQNKPALGLAIDRMWRQSSTWFASVLLTLAAKKATLEPDERLTELNVQIIDKIMSVNGTFSSETPGGVIDEPTMDFWYDSRNQDQPLMNVGSAGALVIKVSDPVIVT